LPYGSGLSAQVMAAQETTWATPVTVTRAYEFLGETMIFDPTWLASQGLKAGQAVERASRVTQSRFNVAGDLTMEHTDQGGMGLLWKHALGSAITTPTLVATTAYKQIHVPGPRTGFGLTVQIGRPQTDGTVRAHTFNGCKCLGFEFSCSDNQVAQLKLTLNGQNESTATGLAAATYTAGAGVFSFADAANFKIGGTATTSAGETTIASGVAVTTVATGVTITGTIPAADSRYGLGNAGLKKEQIENGIQTYTIALAGEYTQRTEFYDLLKSGAATPLQLDFSHGDAGSANPYLLSFIFPAVKVKEGGPQVSGADLVDQSITLQAYDDGTTNPVMQVKLVSKDSVLAP